MFEADIEIPIKVLIVGNGAVGKSSMIQRYCKGIFTQDYKKTIGVDFLEKKLSLEGEELRLMIWDTAGQEEFDSMTKAYYRDAEACVVAFSTTDRDSFEAVESWIKKVEAEVGSIPMVLVQNKVDLMDQAVMTKEEANAKAEAIRLKFFRTSVQENFQIDQVFQYLAEQFLKRMREREAANASKTKASNFGDDGAKAESSKPNFQAAKTGNIKLEAPKRRTGGKKSSSMFSGCSIL